MFRVRRMRTIAMAAALLLLCGGLAAVIADRLQDGRPSAGAETAAGDAVELAAPTMPQYELPPLEAYPELLDRPLFSSTRRPVEADDAPVQAAVTSQGLDVVLTGVIIADGNKVALIVPRNTAKPVRLIEGQGYQGWTLSEVQSEGVIFRQGTRAQILELDRKPGAAIAKN